VRGSVTLRDQVFITVEDFESAKKTLGSAHKSDFAIGVDTGAVLGSGAMFYDPTAGRVVPASAKAGKLTGAGLESSKFDIWMHLRGASGTVDLATEIALLRAAILDLHDRLGGAK
jgi:hypothetical protein